MANDILFRWEDSPALKHHCGFCARPLNHPGVKNSCLGTHSEPCLRFHQALFMRNRGHMCASCIGSDEAHHKRHLEICAQLRLVYKINGEDPSLILAIDGPRDQRENGKYQDDTRPPDAADRSRGSSPDSLPITKKKMKDAKKLAKAASRPKVITHDEIKYVGSILHPPSGAISDDSPNNSDEVEEIERHLRYNANVYTRGVKRSVLNSFANIPDADLDFEQEMDRILNHLKVADLLKRNTKNRGLQGKEMKTFENLVADLKTMIVEDLMLVKRDEMGTRMRRAGYLRYASRTSFTIVEDRYTAKDWKTGERIVLPDPEATPQTPMEKSFIHDIITEMDRKENTPASTNSGPDFRHLTCRDKKIGSGGKVEDVLPTGTGPLLNQAKPKSSQPRLTLRIVANSYKPSTSQPVQTLLSSFASLPPSFTCAPQRKVDSRPPLQNVWFKTPGLVEQPQLIQVSPHKPPAEQKTIEPSALQKKIKKVVHVVVQPVSRAPAVHSVQVPEHSPVKKLLEVTKDTENPPVSQKKAKKKVRETRRKEKKQAAQQNEVIEEPEGEDNDEVEKVDQQVPAKITMTKNAKDVCILSGSIPYLCKSEDFRVSVVRTTEEDFYGDDSPTVTRTTFQFPLPPTPPLSIHDFPMSSRSASLDIAAMAPLPPPAVNKNGKQVHWRTDIRDLTVDAI